ncbi:hypothetical protein [Saguinine gammaherpesvirus 1]|uniref:Uncharacterized protein n=1 Tax=Saguinine gammaherpesvirus 1 TaxID=2169901 RepID=A0A9Q8QWW1_9GAMA|nr:hypothetical protein [Saguinine gammaherpesvirus 1]
MEGGLLLPHDAESFYPFFGLWVLLIFLVFVPRLLEEEADGRRPGQNQATSYPLDAKSFYYFFGFCASPLGGGSCALPPAP